MSAAETSAYLLMAGGLIWILAGIAGVSRRPGENDLATRAEGKHQLTDDHPAERLTSVAGHALVASFS